MPKRKTKCDTPTLENKKSRIDNASAATIVNSSTLVSSSSSCTEHDMIPITIEDVPEYLRSSPLYRTFHGTDHHDEYHAADEVKGEDKIMIPKDCFQKTTAITNENDLLCLIKTLQYWCCEDVMLPEVIDFFLKEYEASRRIITNELIVNFPSFGTLLEIAKEYSSSPRPREEAADLAIIRDFTPFLQFLFQSTKLKDSRDLHTHILSAIQAGSCKCLDVLLSQKASDYWLHHSQEFYERTLSSDQRNGFLCLQCLHKHGLPIPETYFREAVTKGYIEYVQFIADSMEQPEDLITDENADLSIKSKSLEVVQFFDKFQRKPNWNHSAAQHFCIKNGCLDILKFLREKNPSWAYNCWLFAVNAQPVSDEMMLYLIDNQCPGMQTVIPQIIGLKKVDFLRTFVTNGGTVGSDLIHVCASCGALECLQYLHSVDCPWNAFAVTAAIQNERVDCLKYLLDHNCPINETCFNTTTGNLYQFISSVLNDSLDAATHGALNDALMNKWSNVLYCCVANSVNLSTEICTDIIGCIRKASITPISLIRRLIDGQHIPLHKYKDICTAAAAAGQISVLEMLHASFQNLTAASSSIVLWDQSTCDEAAANSQLDCLKFAHENGCPWGKSTTEKAATRGDYRTLCYLMENGCPAAGPWKTMYKKTKKSIGVIM